MQINLGVYDVIQKRESCRRVKSVGDYDLNLCCINWWLLGVSGMNIASLYSKLKNLLGGVPVLVFPDKAKETTNDKPKESNIVVYTTGPYKEVNVENLESATPQEVFDFVCEHLIKQNKKANGDRGMCFYRKGGLKCAAGCLIPDHLYKPAMEKLSWRGLIEDYGWTEKHANLIGKLQFIHDRFYPSHYAKQCMINLAKEYNLTLPSCLK